MRIPAVIQWLAWLAYLAGCLLILQNSLADYRPGGMRLFIQQKGEVGESMVWRSSLYFHVIGGLICLFAALPQFSGSILRRWKSVHRVAGRTYAVCMLAVVAPTGFHLAFFAKGGLLGQLGFLTLAFASFATTLAAWRAILPARRDLAAHRAWMIRSFALAATAITFRVSHVAGYFAGLEETTNYVACLWLSLAGNAAVAEILIHRRLRAAPVPIQTESLTS